MSDETTDDHASGRLTAISDLAKGTTGATGGADGTGTTMRPFERRMPPVVGAGMAALTLAIIGGILLVSQIGAEEALTIPTVFIVAALVFEAVAIMLLPTIRPFAWWRFRQVFLVALCAYVVQSGIIGWSFIKNDVPSGPLTLLILGLVVFATIVPLMIAFTTARYQAVD